MSRFNCSFRDFIKVMGVGAILLVLTGCQSACQKSKSEESVIKLFNGKNLDGWYTWMHTTGKNNDPEGLFEVEDGMIHIMGKIFGYMSTEKEYENYRLVAEFKWGEKMFPPSVQGAPVKDVRDAGVMYHIPVDAPDKIFPPSLEFQIQEGDCGDFWILEASITVRGKRYEGGSIGIPKDRDAEKPTGQWNTIEIIADGSTCTHIINGVLVNKGTDASLQKGKIFLQSEGAEIYFRRVDLYPL